MNTVTVYWQRHGDHENDSLTQVGWGQVMSKAQRVVSRSSVNLAITSDKNRTLQTLRAAMTATDNAACISDMVIEPMFGYNCILRYVEEAWPYEDFLATMAQQEKSGGSTNLEFALEIWPPARICRAIYLAALERWTSHIVILPEMAKVDRSTIYIAGHASASYCAPDKTIVPGLVELGGIVQYEIVLKPEFKIISAEHVTAGKD